MNETKAEYVIDFHKMRISSDITGIYWNHIPNNVKFRSFILNEVKRLKKNKFWAQQKIMYIDASVEEHYTQIMYILQEYFTEKKKGFIGWDSFTKETLIKLCKYDEYIYKENFNNGVEFIQEFPNKIDNFIEKFCQRI